MGCIDDKLAVLIKEKNLLMIIKETIVAKQDYKGEFPKVQKLSFAVLNFTKSYVYSYNGNICFRSRKKVAVSNKS